MPDFATLGLKVDANRAGQNVDQFDKKLDRLGKRGTSVQGVMTQLGITFSAGLALRAVIKNTSEAQQAMNQLEAVVKSTGGSAGRSVAELDAMAQALQKTTRFSDETTKAGQALLLTFTNIRGEIFDRTLVSVLDMAQAMGGDLKGAAIQVGKALNDPILGVTALSRVGIQFSESQRDVIREMVETNRLAEAQGIILAELEKEFGGSAEAARADLGGAIAYLKNQMADFFEVTDEGSTVFVDGINAMGDAIPEVRRHIVEFLGGIQILAVGAAVKIGELQLAISKLREGGPARGILDALGLGEGAGLVDPLGLDLFSKALDIDLNQSVSEAEANLARLRQAADETIATMFDGAPVVTDLAAAEEALADATREAAEEAEKLEAAEKLRARLRRDRHRFRQQQASEEEAEARRARERRIKLRNDQIRDAEAEARQREREAERSAREAVETYARAAEQIRDVMGDAYRDIFTEGFDGFTDLADAVGRIFRDLASEIAATITARALGLDEIIAKLREGEKLSGRLGLVAAGGAGFGLGQGGGITTGVLGGAATGFAVGGPVGAAVGALGGFVGGLFGARKESERLREELRRQKEALREQRRQQVENNRRTVSDFHARGLSLTGQDDAASRARLREQQRQELADVVPGIRAFVEFVHGLERMALENEIALREQTEAIEEALDEQLDALDEELDVARQHLAVATDQLREQERTVESLRGVIASLREFSDDLLLGGLSPLSPAERLAEARRQFNDVRNRAAGGDLEAAAALPDAARALLEVSREFNASGVGFVADFNAVRQALADVTDSTEATLTVEERILAELIAQSESLQEQITALEEAKEQAAADAERQIQTIRENFEAQLAAMAEELEELRRQTSHLTSITTGGGGGTGGGHGGDEEGEGGNDPGVLASITREVGTEILGGLSRVEAAVDDVRIELRRSGQEILI